MSGVVDADFIQQCVSENVAKEYLKLYSESCIDQSIPIFRPKYATGNQTAKAISNALTELANSNVAMEIVKQFPDMDEILELPQKMRDIVNPRSFLTRSNVSMRLKYSQYMQLREQVSESMKKVLTSKLFLDLWLPTTRSVVADSIVQHLVLMRYSYDYYAKLMQLESDIISERDFAKIVEQAVDHYPFIPDFLDDNPQFVGDYVTYIVQRVFVALDPLKIHAVPIGQLIAEPLFFEFVKLEDLDDDAATPMEFSPYVVKRFVDDFKLLDADGDGILTKEDLMVMRNKRFTECFIDRVMEVLPGNMDMEWFIRFEAMYKNLGKPWANRIVFDILDVNGDGVFNEIEFQLFYNAIAKECAEHTDPPEYGQVAGEIFDMCQATTNSLTKEEFVNCSRAGTLVHTLVDLMSFIQNQCDDDVGPRTRN